VWSGSGWRPGLGAMGLTLLAPDGCAGGIVGRGSHGGAAAGEAGRSRKAGAREDGRGGDLRVADQL